MSGQSQRPMPVLLPFVDQHAGTDLQSVRLIRLQELGLIRRQDPRLSEGVNPDGVEGRQIAGQTFDLRTTTAHIRRRRQTIARQEIEQLSRRRFQSSTACSLFVDVGGGA